MFADQFYHSWYFAILGVILAITISAGVNQILQVIARVILVMLFIPLWFVWNWAILQYSLRHSFDFHFMLITYVIQFGCFWALANNPAYLGSVLGQFMVFSVIPLMYTIEGFHMRNSRKVILLAIPTLYHICRVVIVLLENSSSNESDDIALHIPAMNIMISVQDTRLLCVFNNCVFWTKKLILLIKHPDCTLLPTYPQVVWINGERQQTLSGSSFARQRTSTMSLDIYKQTVANEAKIYLFEKNSVAFVMLQPEKAQKLHIVHFSKHSWTALSILVIVIICANIFSIFELAIIGEIFGIVILLIGPFTFDLKMMRFYRKSFDFWFKWYNWTVYLVGCIFWNHLESNMDGVTWTEFAFRSCVITTIIFYIICIDAYQVRASLKRRALAMVVGLAVYYQICNLFQVLPLNPWRSWNDRDITIPVLHIPVSVRSMMMSGLSNFILFMGKQLVVMVKHPGTAALELFPKINWIEEDNDKMESDARPGIEVQSKVGPELGNMESDVAAELESEEA